MKIQRNCPVCDFHQLEKSNDLCPRCKTDLNLWNEIIDLPNRYYNQALQMIKASHIDEAKEMLIVALALYPEHIDSQLLLGKVYAELEMYYEAIVVWEKALKQDPENSHEIENLITKVKECQLEVVTRKDEERKRLLEMAKGEEARRLRFRWIGCSALLSVVALIIGILLPFHHPPLHISPGTILEPIYKQEAERLLKVQRLGGIQVDQKNSVIYLFGKVTVPQEKYQLENLIRGIKGVSAIDLSGVEVLHPKGYYYTIRRGDTLWNIAERIWGNGAKYREIYQANKENISDPSSILPGITILIPR